MLHRARQTVLAEGGMEEAVINYRGQTILHVGFTNFQVSVLTRVVCSLVVSIFFWNSFLICSDLF